MKHYFKWDLDNLKYIWKSDLDIKHTVAIDHLSDDDIEKIYKWYHIEYDDWQIVLADMSDIVLMEKKLECRNTILSNYSDIDQRNILMFGTDDDKTKMSTYIQSMLTEFKTNGKDADFSNITP